MTRLDDRARWLGGQSHESTPLRRVAMISLHTSPLDQPGTGDAGGMNVYVIELARRLAGRGTQVDIFTRARSSDLPPLVDAYDGVRVHHVVAGPFEGLTKSELPGQLCTFAREVLRSEAAEDPGHYDLVHSHYWLSGQVGALARDRWGVPLVHSMHTMAKVKNALLAEGDTPEPATRVFGEEQVVAAADMLIANTTEEARELVEFYAADPRRIEVVHPGVDLDAFTRRPGARDRLGLPPSAHVLVFAGRIQPLKAPDVLINAAAQLLARQPGLRSELVVAIVGGASGTGLDRPHALQELTRRLGLEDVVRFVPPASRTELADWFSAASVVCVPSYNESFGLVAIEAQACGAPVVAAAVGGLRTAVRDGESGFLVEGHDPADYARVFDKILSSPQLWRDLSVGAVNQAQQFTWDHTTDATLSAYRHASALLRGGALR